MYYCFDFITDVLLVRLYYRCVNGLTVLLMYYWFDCITDVLLFRLYY